MTTNISNIFWLNTPQVTEEEYSIPLDISDIIHICQEYNKLGWQVQTQMEHILEVGINEAIKNNIVKKESLPFIKNFLESISKNPYFGDAVSQASICLDIINKYEMENQKLNLSCIN